jgi:hypothetical protein
MRVASSSSAMATPRAAQQGGRRVAWPCLPRQKNGGLANAVPVSNPAKDMAARNASGWIERPQCVAMAPDGHATRLAGIVRKRADRCDHPVVDVGGEPAQIPLGRAFEKDSIHALQFFFRVARYSPRARYRSGLPRALRSHAMSAASSTRSSSA